jgi:ParB-like chromosome segregation protein Spo0J
VQSLFLKVLLSAACAFLWDAAADHVERGATDGYNLTPAEVATLVGAFNDALQRLDAEVRALDAATKDAVLKAAAQAETRGWRIAEEKTQWYLKELAAKGMKVLPPSPQLKADLAKVGEQLTADWMAKAGAEGKAVVDAFKK